MAIATLRDAVAEYSPPWLRRNVGGTILRAFGTVLDALTAREVEGVKLRFPGVAPPSALGYVGNDRDIERGPTQTDASYRAQLLAAFGTWKNAGGPRTILKQLRSYFSPGDGPPMRLVSMKGLSTELDSDGNNDVLEKLSGYSFPTGGYRLHGCAFRRDGVSTIGDAQVLYGSNDGDAGFLYIDNPPIGGIGWRARVGGVDTTSYSEGVSVADGAWHTAIVYEDTVTNTSYLAVDGVLRSILANAEAPAVTPLNGSLRSFALGDGAYHLNGRISSLFFAHDVAPFTPNDVARVHADLASSVRGRHVRTILGSRCKALFRNDYADGVWTDEVAGYKFAQETASKRPSFVDSMKAIWHKINPATGVVTRSVADNWKWDRSSRWHRGWCIIDGTGLWSLDYWDQVGVWGDGGVWGSDMTYDQVRSFVAIFKKWKPANVLGQIILTFEPSLFEETDARPPNPNGNGEDDAWRATLLANFLEPVTT